ncbi:galectin-2-like isoform X10 [Anguilla rostrata]|uniref:galectin-2-like isoform X9 n=1 Tax=Anguilla rostrata TaxID=7938 RepID=UPI0030D0D949
MSNLELKNLSIKPGTELRVSGVTHQDVIRFSINVGNSRENIALHFNPRFDTGCGVIVLNSMKNGSWQDEVKGGNFPFQRGQEFKVTITFADDKFYINLRDGHVLQFPNRLAGKKYDYVWTEGEVTINGVNVI